MTDTEITLANSDLMDSLSLSAAVSAACDKGELNNLVGSVEVCDVIGQIVFDRIINMIRNHGSLEAAWLAVSETSNEIPLYVVANELAMKVRDVILS